MGEIVIETTPISDFNVHDILLPVAYWPGQKEVHGLNAAVAEVELVDGDLAALSGEAITRLAFEDANRAAPELAEGIRPLLQELIHTQWDEHDAELELDAAVETIQRQVRHNRKHSPRATHWASRPLVRWESTERRRGSTLHGRGNRGRASRYR